MSELLGSSAWRRDTGSSRNGLIGSLLVHGALGAAFVLSATANSDPKPLQKKPASIKMFDVSAPVTQRPLDEEIAIAEPKAMISKSLPKPSDAEVAQMAVPDGGSGSEVMIWTPPQPGTTYQGKESSSPAALKVYVDIPVPLIVMPGDDLKPSLARFDGTKFVDIAKKFSDLGPEVRVEMTAELAIDIDGKPIGCSVVEGHFSGEIDVLGCQILMSNLYHPARDRAGKVVMGFVRDGISWDGRRFSVINGQRVLAMNDLGQVEMVDAFSNEEKDGDEIAGVVDASR